MRKKKKVTKKKAVSPPKKEEKRNGRPPKKTPEIEKRICDLVSVGCYQNIAALKVGITDTTLSHWKKKDAKFKQAIDMAEGLAESAAVANIVKASQNERYWPAAAWLLERRFPKRWAKQDKLDIGGTDGQPIHVNLTRT